MWYSWTYTNETPRGVDRHTVHRRIVQLKDKQPDEIVKILSQELNIVMEAHEGVMPNSRTKSVQLPRDVIDLLIESKGMMKILDREHNHVSVTQHIQKVEKLLEKYKA